MRKHITGGGLDMEHPMGFDRRAAAPLVTVVIPTRNGGERFGEVLEALLAQRLSAPFDVLAIDSGSHDGTQTRLQRAGIRTIAIPPEAFNHGETRNMGARRARGRWIVFLVQDATPIGPYWLSALLEGIGRGEGIVGGSARHIPRADADPVFIERLREWTPAAAPTDGPRLIEINPRTDSRTGEKPAEQRPIFDNVCSIVCRRHLLAHPFPRCDFAEDLLWARDQIRAGHTLTYIPDALVWHSHRRPFLDVVRRTFREHRVLRDHFGLRTVPNMPIFMRQAVGIAAASPRHGLPATKRLMAELLGQYLAGRPNAKGDRMRHPENSDSV